MSKRIFVIGGLGFVGAEVSALLSRSGYEVAIYDNGSVGSEDRLPSDVRENIVSIRDDIRDEAALFDALHEFLPDVVINLAAIHYIPQCNADPAAALDVNVMGTQKLISALKRLSIVPRLIMTSSASVYGSSPIVPQTEDQHPTPVDVYGSSKVMDELLVRTQLSDFIILRLFNVFGSNDPHPHLIPNIVAQLDQSFVRLGNKDSRRDYVYVKDVARAFLCAVATDKTSRTYNVGSGVTRSVGSVCETLRHVSGRQVVFEFDTPDRTRQKDPPVLQADISLIRNELGWKPQVAFEAGAHELLQVDLRLAGQAKEVLAPAAS